jgi:hypothetical protein
MVSGGSSVGPRGQRFDAGEGTQTFAQLQDTGAEVVGADWEKVGDADFVGGRTLRSDLHIPVTHIGEVTTDNKIVLDVSAEEAKEARWGPSTTRQAGRRASPIAPRWRKGPWSSVKRTRKRPSSGRTATEDVAPTRLSATFHLAPSRRRGRG